MHWWDRDLLNTAPRARVVLGDPVPTAASVTAESVTADSVTAESSTTKSTAEQQCRVLVPTAQGWQESTKLPRRAALVLPRNAVWRRRVAAPAKLRPEERRAAAQLRLSRLSPLKPDTVLLAVSSRDTPPGGPRDLDEHKTTAPPSDQSEAQHIEIALTPKALVDASLSDAAPWRSALAERFAGGETDLGGASDGTTSALPRIEHVYGDPEGEFVFRAPERHGAMLGMMADRPLRAVAVLVAGIALATLLTAAILPLWRAEAEITARSRAVAALVAETAPIREAAQRLDQLRAASAAQEWGSQDGTRPFSSIALLAAVTRALPDTVWIDTFRLSDTRLSIGGTAGEAATALEQLAALPMLKDVRFEAATVRQPDGRERFQIAAAVAGARLEGQP
ncbi:MAG: PilN domain-containing protein [Pseudomonadota bacterium]